MRLFAAAFAATLLTSGIALAQTLPSGVTPDQVTGITGQPSAAAPTAPAAAAPAGQSSPYNAIQAPTNFTPPAVTGPSGAIMNTGGSGAAMPPTVQMQFPPALMTANDSVQAPIFGSDLFTGAFAGSTASEQPGYVIQVGDVIEVRTYGNASLDISDRVGPDGNLFVPVIGPVHVQGTTRSALNSTMQSALSGIYTNIHVSAQVVQPSAIGVYVTGNVSRPGRYLGLPNDTVLYYLDRAGGVDGQRGSYRNIEVRHKNGTRDLVDLYRFRIEGAVPEGHFQDGDTIVVMRRGPMVVVTGLVRNPFAFELKGTMNGVTTAPALGAGQIAAGSEIEQFAVPDRTATNVSVHSFDGVKPVAAYLSILDFRKASLGDGDHVEYRSDTLATSVSVLLSAKLAAPSVYVVPKGTTLGELLAKVPIDNSNLDPQAVHILRVSVQVAQQAALSEALLNLQKQAFASTAITQEAASIQSSQGALVTQFVAAAKQVKPTGQLAVYRNGKFQDVRLEEGDQIIIPEKSDTILVAGEVLAPGAAAYRRDATIGDYINDAGGFTNQADTGHFVLKGLDGNARVADRGDEPRPGDEIMVLPEVADQNWALAQSITQIIFQIAISAAAVFKN